MLEDMGVFRLSDAQRKAFPSAMVHELSREATAVELERDRADRERRGDRHIALAAAIGAFVGGFPSLLYFLTHLGTNIP